MQLRTPRLILELQTPEHVQGMIAALPEEQRAQVSPAWLEMVQSTPDADPWVHGFIIQRRGDPQPIGFCGFKGPPCPSGSVEIAYGIETTNQGQGFATEAARALVAYAQTCPTATSVLAHTMPEPNASTRVLTKCGFVMTGETVDPHDGPVWRWELPLR
jgi:[ribosomal protein S5]-alanine N-acetyltransferase